MKRIKRSGLFDKKWYLKTYPDVARAHVDPLKHYLKHGWVEGRNPSPKFDGNAYLRSNPDVAAAKMCPLVHYVNHGRAEGRYAVTLDAQPVVAHKKDSILKRILKYPERVYDEYHKLKDELRTIK